MGTATSLPALVAQRAAAAPGTTIMRRKARGIWQTITWAEMADDVQRIAAALHRQEIGAGDTVAIIAGTRPETVFCDLAIQTCGAASLAIHTDAEADQIAHMLRATGCRAAFVEGEEQLDALLTIRGQCPALARIIIFDMKGLREFNDAQCISLAAFADRGERDFDWKAAAASVPGDSPAVIFFPLGDATAMGQVLTQQQILGTLDQARRRLGLSARDERLAVLSMSDPTERLWGLYAALESGCVSNYLESADTAAENLQELRPTVLGADADAWAHLHGQAVRAAKDATVIQRGLYDWAIKAGRMNNSISRLADLLVLGAVRRAFGLNRIRLAYVSGTPVSPPALDWARSLGIAIERIEDTHPAGQQPGRQYDPIMQQATA